jgi:hypothetical protein
VDARAGAMKCGSINVFSGDQPPMTGSTCPAVPLGSGA